MMIVLLFILPLVFPNLAWSFSEDVDAHGGPTIYPYPRIILLGPSGVGKSSLANVLAGCSPTNNSCFETCAGTNSCTSNTTVNVVTYLRDDAYGSMTLVDSPGFSDTGEDGDAPIITNILDVLKNVLKDANMILLCIDYNQRFGPSIKNMVLELESLFGREQFWHHVVIEVTKWHFSENDIFSRNLTGVTEESALADINTNLKEISHLQFNLEGVFIDSYAPLFPNDEMQTKYFSYYTEQLWTKASTMPTLEFHTIEDILIELDECKKENDCLSEAMGGRLSTLEAAVRINEIDISENKENMIAHWKQILANSGNIHQNEIKAIENEEQIDINAGKIDTNTGKIDTNTRNIDKIASEINNPAIVAICGSQSRKTTTGAITYDSLSASETTDSSYLSTSSGKFHVRTSGMYQITWSANVNEQAVIKLYEDDNQLTDAEYYTSQTETAHYEQGSMTVLVPLTSYQRIHLEATTNTGNIDNIQFCIELIG